jgi:hypothetical protein
MLVPAFSGNKSRSWTMDMDTLHPRTTIATGPHSMSLEIDLEVGQVPQAVPRDRAIFSPSHHHIPFG